MLIKENDLRRLIRRKLLESCATPSERNPDADEQEIERIWEDLREEFLESEPHLAHFLERTKLFVVRGEETPDLYDRATRDLPNADALFAARMIKNPNWLLDIVRRRQAQEAGNHNVIYYHMYGVDDRMNCLDADIVEEKLRHELEHFVSRMSAFEGAGSAEGHELGHESLSEYYAPDIDTLLDQDFWIDGSAPQSMPSSFQQKWNELDGQDSRVSGSAESLWSDISGQWTNYEEARAMIMTAKRVYPTLGSLPATLLDIADADIGGRIATIHLQSVLMMLKDGCRGSQSCQDAWSDLK